MKDKIANGEVQEKEKPFDLMAALKESIRIAQQKGKPERIYQPSGLEFDCTVEVPTDDSLEKIDVDTLQLRPGTVAAIGTRPTDASIMLVSDKPHSDGLKHDSPDREMFNKLRSSVFGVAGIYPDDCYSSYAIKHFCSPACSRWECPNGVASDCNRDPMLIHQIQTCSCSRSLLLREVLVLRPTVIIALGGLAAKLLLDTDEFVEDLRNRINLLRINGSEFSVVVTFDLAYELNLLNYLPDLKQDFALVRAFLNPSTA